eukprot:NODE_18_length_47517_cov_0.674814.p16 type:complete len:287 gc:universal NODE_18_length_47517_cov_0.674814:4778-3918(-)
MKNHLLGDKELIHKIFSGQTKEPITRQKWIQFVESTYTTECTLFYFEISKFMEVYRRECVKLKIESKLDNNDTTVSQIKGMQDYQCDPKSSEDLDIWAKSICAKLVDLYILPGSRLEINIYSDIRDHCLNQFRNGEYSPAIFLPAKQSIMETILQNDLPKFKETHLNQNIQKHHQNLRLIFAMAFLVFTGSFYGLIMGFQEYNYYRLCTFPLIYESFIYFLQWKSKFCVYFAGKRKANIVKYEGVTVEDEYACIYQDMRASEIRKKSIIFSLAVYIILLVCPPYKW